MDERTTINNETFQRTRMQKERIIQKLKERGCRITKQRLILLDIILEENCTCCKEIYYKASKCDKRIGSATVYRMINVLEEIGAISRKNMYRIEEEDTKEQCSVLEITPDKDSCTIAFDDDTIVELPVKRWNQVIQMGLMACGYDYGHAVEKVSLQ